MFARELVQLTPHFCSRPCRAWIGAVTAAAAYTPAMQTYSSISLVPMKPTIRSYVMALPYASVLATSKAHQAQASPRRNAVAATAIPRKPKATLYAPNSRNSSNKKLAVDADAAASSAHDCLVNVSYPFVIHAPGHSGAMSVRAPHRSRPASAKTIASQANWRTPATDVTEVSVIVATASFEGFA